MQLSGVQGAPLDLVPWCCIGWRMFGDAWPCTECRTFLGCIRCLTLCASLFYCVSCSCNRGLRCAANPLFSALSLTSTSAASFWRGSWGHWSKGGLPLTVRTANVTLTRAQATWQCTSHQKSVIVHVLIYCHAWWLQWGCCTRPFASLSRTVPYGARSSSRASSHRSFSGIRQLLAMTCSSFFGSC